MRRWIMGGVVLVACVLACVELVGVHDLSCSAGDASSVPDPCIGEGGVSVLGTNGELRALGWLDGSVVAAGYDALDGGPRLSFRVLTANGVTDQFVDEAGVANGVAIDSNGEVWVVGGNSASFMLRDFEIGPLKEQPGKDYPTMDSKPSVALEESVAVSIGGDNTLYGTSTDGGLVVMRVGGLRVDHDGIFGAAVRLRATAGVMPAGLSPLVTILGDTPDSGFGLAMARFVTGTGNNTLPLDPNFGNDGGLVAKFGDGGSARALLLADDSSYWVGGVAAGKGGFVLAHITPNGIIGESWTSPGNETGANAILAIDGGVLAAGFADGNLAVARFTLDAGIDKTFGDAGVLEIPLPGELKAIVQTDNRYVVGGFTTINGTKRWVLVWLIP